MKFLRRYPISHSIASPLELRPSLWLRGDQGVYSDGARQFTVASSQWLTIASNASLQVGDIDWTLCGWFYLDGTGSQTIICKRNTAATDIEWMLWFSSGKFRWTVRNTANTLSTTHATTAATYTSGQWYFVLLEHNAAADTLAIQVNSTVDTLSSYTGGIRASTNAFRIAGYSDDTVTSFGGRVDSLMITKKVLSAAEKTDLYNSGAGRTYATATSTVKDASLVSWWNMNELTGSATDSHGSNTLTASASSPTANAGVVSTVAVNTDYGSLWMDQSGNNRHFGQTTASKRPTYTTNVLNGRPSLRFDGIDDFLTPATANTSATATIFVVANQIGSPTGDRAIVGENKLSVYARSSTTDQWGTYNNDFRYSGQQLTSTHKILTLYAAAYNDLRFRTNGKDEVSVVAGSSWPNRAGNGAIGSALDTGAQYHSGDILERIDFSRALSRGEIMQVERYLASRYGVAL